MDARAATTYPAAPFYPNAQANIVRERRVLKDVEQNVIQGLAGAVAGFQDRLLEERTRFVTETVTSETDAPTREQACRAHAHDISGEADDT